MLSISIPIKIPKKSLGFLWHGEGSWALFSFQDPSTPIHTHITHALPTHSRTRVYQAWVCAWVCVCGCVWTGGRYIGWPYFYNLLVGPSYIPSPLYLATVSHVHPYTPTSRTHYPTHSRTRVRVGRGRHWAGHISSNQKLIKNSCYLVNHNILFYNLFILVFT